MAEIADEILNGDRCSECAVWIGDGDGIPRLCPACDLDGEPPAERPKNGRHRKRPVPLRDVVVPDKET